MGEIAKTYPESLVLSNIYVYWPRDDIWYRGKIIKYLPGSKKFKILYDDGEYECLDLTKKEFAIAEDLKTNEEKKI